MQKKIFGTVAIVGVGLIGGSVALALRKYRLCNKIIGVSLHGESVDNAKRLRIVDAGSTNINIISGADLVILAVPIDTILELSAKISRIIRPGCIVTDVGSTKKIVVEKLEKIFPNFIGGHPLAGSEKRGADSARADLFAECPVLLTPTEKTKPVVQNRIKKMWQKLGARTFIVTPELHDKALSFTSHLPHIAAFSLIKTIPDEFFKFSSTGLKDTTRIAGSDPKLWTDILLSNNKNILDSIDAFEKSLVQVKKTIKNKDSKQLQAFLSTAKLKREKLP